MLKWKKLTLEYETLSWEYQIQQDYISIAHKKWRGHGIKLNIQVSNLTISPILDVDTH